MNGMPLHFKVKLLTVLLGLALVVLPLGLLWLRRRPRTRRNKILMVLALVLHGICDVALLIFLFLELGWVDLEWRGGYVPVLTWRKSQPDFDALERNREGQKTIKEVAADHRGIPWPCFRGARRDGQCDEPILTTWPTNGLRLLWRQPCGGGYSSFAMVDGHAFTLEQRRDDEVAVAYDVETGHELWSAAWPAKFVEYHSDEGPRSTPTWDEGRIYALGATGEFRCLDATNGAVLWSKNVVTENGGGVPDYGVTPSPLVVDDKVIVETYARQDRSVVCYDKHDGRMIWQTAVGTLGYTSPMLVSLGGERHVLIGGRPDLHALRVEDGVERWTFPWPILNHERPIAQPVIIGTNQLLISAAYMTGSTAFEVNRVGDSFETKELWKNRNLKNKFSSSVFYQGFVYGLDEDILTCIYIATGDRKWKDGRYGYGQVTLASGHLVILCADGDLALVKAAPEGWNELARFPALNGKTWNPPAISGGRLLMRNGAEMACFEIGPPQ